jgi:primosomal protein N' (replication factor Y) (superfamily II helicase)
MNAQYANIAFNLPVDSLFTYAIPPELKDEITTGSRVLAPFGKRNITGIVIELPESSDLESIKPIISALDAEPIVSVEMIEFCRWISKYYFCPIGEVIFSAIPKGIIVESKVLYSLNPETRLNKLPDLQKSVAELLAAKPLTIKQIEHRLGSSSVRSVIQSLLAKGVIQQENVTSKEKIKAKYEKFVLFDLREDFADFTGDMLDIFMKENKIKSTCQIKLMKHIVGNNITEISAADLLKATGATPYSLNSLVKKELISFTQKQVNRSNEHDFSREAKIIKLTGEQQSVLDELNHSAAANEFTTFLLFGITGSGKTQVYIEAIKKVLEQDKTAIVLVPEISLTPQVIHRFKAHFDDMVGVIHSKLSDGQRFDVYEKIKSGEIKIVIGARSALFAPLNNIGIIIVDEEHDHSYKQTEKNPKYNARDSAIVRARLNNAVVVLGSATPSLESYYNYKAGKYKLLELSHRALKTKQPQVEIVNMLDELRNPSKYVKHEKPEERVLSSKLIAYIDDALKNKKSVILLQNRRGYSAYQQCLNCGNVKMCVNCDITMIYHKYKNHLRCHYCGYTTPPPVTCEICQSPELKLIGVGTEKIEEEIKRLFPNAKMMRMDSDTVKGKDAHRQILKSFHAGEFDILIGTQMISKGLDFPNVSLVGVISADIGLFIPDFRATEKTFQLLMQVAGRSGRTNDFGKVVIQTMNPDNFIFPLVMNHDYTGYFEKEIKHRFHHNYPPLSRMILIEVETDNQVRVNQLSRSIFEYFVKEINEVKNSGHGLDVELMRPAPALIYKVKNRYRYHIILKVLKSTYEASTVAETLIKNMQVYLEKEKESLKIRSADRISIDVDPLSFY